MKKRLFMLFTGIIISVGIIIAQDQTINGNLTVNGKLSTGELYLKRSNATGWGETYLNYSGHNLYIGSTPGMNAHNEIHFRPGGSSQGYLYTALILHQASGIDVYSKRVQIHSSGNTFFNGGNVGIGTEKPTVKLDVNGTIRSKEVKIEATGWADFVFGKDYQLPSLSEVAAHIEEKGTLPDIPSEKEVIENGINVAEMQAKLLQKIEELTLYVIEQEKEIKGLKKEINTLKNK